MRRIHTSVIAVVLAVAAVAGMFAVSRTTQLGAAARTGVPAAQIAARNRQLDKIERALLAEAKGPAQAASQVTAQRPTVYVRPKPIVRVVHRAHGEHEDEAEGGGFDD
jgi:hypothetical protein